MKLFALILFVLTYALMIALPKHRPWVALTSAVVFLVSGIVPLASLREAIDFNVLLMLAGTMGTVSLFIQSQMPNRMAEMILKKTPNVMWVAVAMSLFAGVVSAFVDNVATVLMVAPIALEICKKLKTNPVPFIIAIAVSSNLQGAATLVGDTTAIMLGSYANMSFLDFIIYEGKPGIFFAVELGAAASAMILAWLFRHEKTPVPKDAPRTVVTDYVPTVLLTGMIVLLISASFIPNKPDITNGLICVTLLVIGMVYSCGKTRDWSAVTGPVKAIDFETIGLLFGLPVGAVGALTVQRTWRLGVKAGLLTGLGSSVADCFYACVGAFGLTLISDFLLRWQGIITALGGALILIMGLKSLIRPQGELLPDENPLGGAKLFLTSFAIGITNPAAILTFLFAFTYFGISEVSEWIGAILLVAGVFLGTYFWWGTLSALTQFIKKKAAKFQIRTMNRIFGGILCAFGIIVFVRLFL